ncbi:HAMP domain-containing sensor histidine kinase [Aquipuribacter hungaricus]|uniref:Signal transduction histidine-protein kinase/phosphatase MprB n=1 Tax=Aquipuribacter hungaricus TaxID=545624 RepID=A0ABV7WI73_9MICO
MRDRLQVRVTVVALAVMAVTLAVVALVTWRLIDAAELDDVDRVLEQVRGDVAEDVPGELAAATGVDGVLSPAEAGLAGRRLLSGEPGSDVHLTAVVLGPTPLVTTAGPAALRRLRDAGTLPAGEVGSVVTVPTDQGPVRVLTSDLVTDDGTSLGQLRVYGSLAEGRAASRDALLRIALAGGVGLLVGAVLLLVAMGRALRPVADLAAAARGTGTGEHRRVPEPERMDEVGTLAHEFNGMVDRLAAAEQQRRELLASVSHELRTPLAVAQGHLEMFTAFGPGDADAARETAEVLRRELERLGRIVEDLTAVTRGVEVGPVQREPVFVPDVLEQLVLRVQGLGLEGVDVAVAGAPPVVVVGDEDRLTQCLLALVINARTHTPAGTPVRVRAEEAGAGPTGRSTAGSTAAPAAHGPGAPGPAGPAVLLVVEDDGPGIDPEVLPRVFEPFVTTRPGGARRTSGLGLAVVRSLTEAQGGTVEVDPSWPGARVVLRLPVEQADDGSATMLP